MSSFTKFLFCAVLTLNVFIVFSTVHNTIRGVKFLCGTHSPSHVNISCSFKRVNRTTEFWSSNGFYLFKAENLYVNITTYARQQNLEWRPHMIINYMVDVCKYMDGSLANKVIDVIVNDLKKYSNYIHPCPYYGNVYIRNLTFNDQSFPPIVPAADVFIDFQYYTFLNGKLKLLHYLRPYLEVKTKGIIYF